ncbi:fibrinogen C domain-containing protein 1-like isoform X2 [Dendronephthya gigantea]|nr:fibrinogen C domain-containing protein 1-like isoform X2 [Dendronephthya gigantea]
MNLILSVVVFTSVMSYTSEPLKENSYVNQLIESYEKKMDADLANLKSQILNYLDKKENIACLTTVPPTTTPKPTTGQSTTPKPTTGKPTSDKHTSTTMQPVPGNSSCATLFKSGERKDGVYTINPDNLGAFQVRCDMTSDGGGWTVFQRRVSGSVDFYRNWQNYSDGFGDLTGNLWLGLDKIHRLTESGQNVLRVDLMNFDNETAYAK